MMTRLRLTRPAGVRVAGVYRMVSMRVDYAEWPFTIMAAPLAN
jgi:hypothetical protein